MSAATKHVRRSWIVPSSQWRDTPRPDQFSTLQPVDLSPYLDGDPDRIEPTILRRRDRIALFYAGMVAFVFGTRGVGKSWLSLLAVAQQIRGGRNVIVLDYEDVPTSYIARLRLLGVPDDEIRERLHYFRIVDPLTDVDADKFVRAIQSADVSLVVIDSLGEALGLAGINENNDNEVAPWLRRFPRRFADAGAAVVLIDHVTKAAENPRDPSGTKRKGAAAQVMYRVDESAPLGEGRTGRLRIVCTKDRHGQFSSGEHVGDFVMTSDAAGTRVEFYEPGGPSAERGDRLEAEILEVVAENPGISLRGIEGVVTGRSAKIRRTVEALSVRGELVEDRGARGARIFTVSTTSGEDEVEDEVVSTPAASVDTPRKAL